MVRFLMRALTCIWLAVVLLPVAPAQVNSAGSIAGQVNDTTGAVVPNATIIAVQSQTNVQWKTITGDTGNYTFPNLPVGTYTLSAQKEGFSKEQINSVILNVGDELRTNFALKVGAISDTVQVSSNAVNVDTESGNIGDVVSAQSIESLPLVTRNFVELVELVPGVSSDIGDDVGFASYSSLAISVNGVRNNANLWMVDGVPNQDVYNGNNAIIPDIDALAEFRVDRGNYTAEQGRSSGAVVNAILKSGTNQFHGTAFEFLRNGDLNSNYYFNNRYGIARPDEHRNNFGYTVGGPIKGGPFKKDQLFFFWSEEWRRIIEPSSANPTVVPTDKEIAGDFSEYAALNLAEPLVTSRLAANPLCTGCVVGQPFPGGTVTVDGQSVTEAKDVIPSGLLDAQSLALIKNYYPRAQAISSSGIDFTSAASATTTTREELIRMDYNLNDKWKAFAHYVQDQNHIGSPYSLFNENVLPYVNSTVEFEPMQSFAVNLTGTLTPDLVNEVQFGIYHDIIRITEAPSISRTVGNIDIPYYFPNQINADDRIPQLSLRHYAGINTTWPFLNGFLYHRWSDNLSWFKGRHNYKFGATVTEEGKNEESAESDNNGYFYFYGSQTGSDLADMLTGYSDEYTEAQTLPMQHLRYWDNEAYAQDQWQITHRLSLTYGLRYTDYSPVIDLNNLLDNFVPGLYNPSLAPTVSTADGSLSNIALSQLSGGANGIYLPNNGIIVAGVNSPYGNAIFSAPKLNMAPRAGFSYDLFGNGKTALRGGYGLYYDRTAPYELGDKGNPPFNASVTIRNILIDTLAPASGGSSVPVRSGVGLVALNTKYTNPYNQQYSFGVQREVYRNTVVNLDYVHTQGSHLLYETQLNQTLAADQLAVAENLTGESGSAVPIAVDSARPYAGYTGIAQFTPDASASYNALQASVRAQFGKSLTLNANYTFSKVLTDAASDTYSPQDSNNLKADRGLATFDRPHMLIVDYVWTLPSFSANALAKALIGGWQWSSILHVSSGEPIGATLGIYGNSGVIDSTQRPNLVAGRNAQDGKGVTDWLNPNAFATPALGTFGNAPVVVGRLPRGTQMNSSISKDFPIYEKVNALFKLESTNIFNHPIFNQAGDADTTTGDARFGEITGQGSAEPRYVQAGLTISF